MEIRNHYSNGHYVIIGAEGVPIIRTISSYPSKCIEHFLEICDDIENPKGWKHFYNNEGCRVQKFIFVAV